MEERMEEKGPDPLAEAYATIERDRARRARECSEALLRVLGEHGCRIEVELTKQPDGAFRPSITIEAI